MPSRPPPQPLPTASSSSLQVHTDTLPLFPLFAQLAFHIISAKLDGELAKVYGWIDELGGACVALDEALFVVTALKGRARLEKAIGRRAMVGAKPTTMLREQVNKRVVSTDYIHDSYQRALERRTTLSPWQEFVVVPRSGPSRPMFLDESPPKRRKVDALPDLELLPADVPFADLPKRCVERPCPLICVNQDIVSRFSSFPLTDQRHQANL